MFSERVYAAASYVLLALILINAAMDYNRGITHFPPTGDGIHNVSYAYNLVRYGTYSAERDDPEEVEPSLRREPLYPALLAAWMAATVDVDGIELKCLLRNIDACRAERVVLKYPQVVLMLMLVAAAYWTAWRLTGIRAAGLAAAFLVANNATLFRFTDNHFTEIPAALLLLMHCYGLARLVQSGFKQGRFTAGLSLGLLALTKAAFFYWVVLLVPLCLGLAALRRVPAAAALILAACAALPPAAWVARNAVSVDEAHITGRGGEILAIRAEYTTMSWEEYWTAYLYYSPRFQAEAADRYGRERFEKLDRTNPDGYYRRVKEDRGIVYDSLDTFDEDTVRRRAFQVLAHNWPMQAALVPLFAYRGVFRIEDSYEPLKQETIPAWAFLVFTLTALAGRQGRAFAFTLPVWYAIAFHAALTHFIPRYSYPLLPVMSICATWLLWQVLEWIFLRNATGRRDEAALLAAVLHIARKRAAQAAAAGLLSAFLIAYAAYRVIDPELELQMKGQLFWKSARGEPFSEQQSRWFDVMVDGGAHRYEVDFDPPVTVEVLRLDPVNQAAATRIEILGLRYRTPGRREAVELGPGAGTSWHCVNCNWIDRDAGAWTLQPLGHDPYLIAPPAAPAAVSGVEIELRAVARQPFRQWLLSGFR